jgi:hypothetical protein
MLKLSSSFDSNVVFSGVLLWWYLKYAEQHEFSSTLSHIFLLSWTGLQQCLYT